ncbi:hypothetical protein D3C81_1130450 [compost metagenome]
MQDAVFHITVTGINGRENGATGPGSCGFYDQYRAGAVSQQLPVLGGEKGFDQ